MRPHPTLHQSSTKNSSEERVFTAPVRRRHNILRHGFSLIEVTISLGIVASVLIPVVALLPYSMSSMREAIDISSSSRIIERIVSDAQLTDYDDLDDLDGEIRYFDDQSNDITDNYDTDAKIRHLYTARIRVPTVNNSLGGVTLPTRGTSGNSIREFTRRLFIDVATTRGDTSFEFDSAENKKRLESFVTFVSKTKDLSGSEKSFAAP